MSSYQFPDNGDLAYISHLTLHHNSSNRELRLMKIILFCILPVPLARTYNLEFHVSPILMCCLEGIECIFPIYIF